MSYVELHAHSSYSFLDGASLPTELAIAAAEHGYDSFALTDHDGVWGAMEFAQACEPLGVRPIVGAELSVTDGHPFHLTLLVEDASGRMGVPRQVRRSVPGGWDAGSSGRSGATTSGSSFSDRSGGGIGRAIGGSRVSLNRWGLRAWRRETS